MIDTKFLKFLIVGVINTIFGYSVFAIIIWLNFHYSFAALVATILGILFNFKTIGHLVFGNDDNTLIFKFVGVYTFTYLLNVVFLTIFNVLKLNMFFAGAILILPLAVISFIVNKKFVFKEKK